MLHAKQIPIQTTKRVKYKTKPADSKSQKVTEAVEAVQPHLNKGYSAINVQTLSNVQTA